MQAKRAEEYRAFLERQKQEQDAKKARTQAERAKAREEQERLHEVRCSNPLAAADLFGS